MRTNTALKAVYSYDIMDRVTGIQWLKGTNVLADFDYGYNSASMITQRQNTVGSAQWSDAYTMDDLDRLVGESRTQSSNTQKTPGSRLDKRQMVLA